MRELKALLEDSEFMARIMELFPTVGELRGVDRGGGTAGRNFILLADDKKYFLRGRNANYSSEQEILYDHSLLKHLAQMRIPVAVPLSSSEGRTWAKMDGRVYELYEYINGRRYISESIADLKKMAAAMAKYHLAVEGFVPQGSKVRAVRREDHPALIAPLLEELRGEADGPTETIIIHLLDQLQLALDNLPDDAYLRLPQLVIHGDLHPANVIFDHAHNVHLTDFDWASVQAKARDLSDGLLFFASRRESPIEVDDIISLTQPFVIDLQRSRIFLDAYRRHKAVTDDEIKALPWLMRSRWIQMRAKGSGKVPEGRRLRYLIHEVEGPLNWLDGHGDELIRSLS
jgi:Ser/Thr protein kinase RdoA (MazF antagonist)